MKWMGVLISIGAMISFFALALSCLNAGSRVLFTMGRYGIFPISVGSSHKKNLTPHVAITLFAAIQFLIPTTFILLSYAAVGGWQMAPFDAFNDAGLFGAMGFCGAYVLISLATPFYLKKIGELKASPHRDRRHRSGSLGRADCRHGLSGAGVAAELFPVHLRRVHLGRRRAGFDPQPQPSWKWMASARCSKKPRWRRRLATIVPATLRCRRAARLRFRLRRELHDGQP